MDAGNDVYDNEEEPDVRLKDGLDIGKLQIGEGQEFEVDADEYQNGKVSFELTSGFRYSLTVTELSDNIPMSRLLLKKLTL